MSGLAVPVASHDEDHAATQVPWQEASEGPDRIMATIAGDPATSISISWRTAGTITQARAEIAKARPDARFDRTATALQGDTQVLDVTQAEHAGVSVPVQHNQGLPQTSHHSVRFDELDPDTLYTYRVEGAEGHWSEWFQTRSAPRSGPLRSCTSAMRRTGWTRTGRGSSAPPSRARPMPASSCMPVTWSIAARAIWIGLTGSARPASSTA